MRRRADEPIRRATLGVALVSSLLSAVLVVGIAFTIIVDVTVGTTRDYAESLAEALADSAIEHLLLEMHVSLEGLAEAAIGRHDVTEVLIADARGLVVACPHPEHLGKPVEAIAAASLFERPETSGRPQGFFGDLFGKFSLLRKGSVGWASPVAYAEARLGTVVVYISLDSTKRELARLGVATLGMLALLFLLSTLVSSRLAGRIAVPVEAMADNARRIARGETPEPAPPTHIRELGQLGADLEAMARTLSAREAAIEAARDLAEAARAVAESASAARTAFLENASHELRTPLNGISGLLSMLESSGDSEIPRLLPELRERARILASVVDGMIEAAQVGGEAPVLADAPFPSSELVEASTCCGREFFGGTGRDFAVTAERLPAALVGDVRKIAQAVRQLLSNAARHVESGPVALRLSWSAGILAVEVADRGPGIPTERRDELFIPFSRLEDPKRRRLGGVGLGLAIAKRIALAYGGDASVEDAPGGGALFRLRFPLRAVEVGDARETVVQPARDAERRKACVLLVEDEPINRLYERTLLVSEGYSVDEARDGASALDLASASRYDIVLMDIGLPDLSGIDAAAEIRKGGGPNAATPIVAVSAHDLDADRRLCAEAGMNAFVAKPIRERELLERIETFIRA